jgi:hypothetical protein
MPIGIRRRGIEYRLRHPYTRLLIVFEKGPHVLTQIAPAQDASAGSDPGFATADHYGQGAVRVSVSHAKAPAWTRWANVVLRGVHLVALIGLGAALLGAPVAAVPAVAVVAASGAAMFALDLFYRPALLREAAGLAVLLKLALVGWMAVDAGARPALFWIVVAGSVLFAHAPASFRHAVLLPPRDRGTTRS